MSDADDYFPRSVINRQQYQSGLFLGSLPEYLRSPIGGPLPPHQARVYEDFSSPWRVTGASGGVGGGGSGGGAGGSGVSSGAVPSLSSPSTSPSSSHATRESSSIENLTSPSRSASAPPSRPSDSPTPGPSELPTDHSVVGPTTKATPQHPPSSDPSSLYPSSHNPHSVRSPPLSPSYAVGGRSSPPSQTPPFSSKNPPPPSSILLPPPPLGYSPPFPASQGGEQQLDQQQHRQEQQEPRKGEEYGDPSFSLPSLGSQQGDVSSPSSPSPSPSPSPSLSSSLTSNFPSPSPALSPPYSEQPPESSSYFSAPSFSSTDPSSSPGPTPSPSPSPSPSPLPSPSFFSSSETSGKTISKSEGGEIDGVVGMRSGVEDGENVKGRGGAQQQQLQHQPLQQQQLQPQQQQKQQSSLEQEAEGVVVLLGEMFNLMNKVEDAVIDVLDEEEEGGESGGESGGGDEGGEGGAGRLGNLPKDHVIFSLVHEIMGVVQKTAFPSPRDEVSSAFALKLYQNLFEIREKLLLEVYLLLLCSIHRLSPLFVSRVLTDSFIVDCQEERRMGGGVVGDLIVEGLLFPHEIDLPLSSFLCGGSEEGVELGLGLVGFLLGDGGEKAGEEGRVTGPGFVSGWGDINADSLSPYNLTATVGVVKKLVGESYGGEKGGKRGGGVVKGVYGGVHGEDFYERDVREMSLSLFSEWMGVFEKHVPPSATYPTFRNFSSLQSLVVERDAYLEECGGWFSRFGVAASRFCLPGQEIPVVFLKICLVAAIEAYYAESKSHGSASGTAITENQSPPSSPSSSSSPPSSSPSPSSTNPLSETIDPASWWASYRFIYGFCSLVGFLMRKADAVAPPSAPSSPSPSSPEPSSGEAGEKDAALLSSSEILESTPVQILQFTLDLLTHLLSQDVRGRPAVFCQRPYHRLFVSLLEEVSDVALRRYTYGILCSFSSSLMTLNPMRFPSFVFSWLELVSHRDFIPKMLLSPKLRPVYRDLVVDLLLFLEPFLFRAELTPPLRLLYKGTLRMLLVLLHDFPEFLCDNHFTFCDVLPPTCIQIRNLILSAFPRNMRLPDPFTPNLKVDLLPEINQPPCLASNYMGALLGAGYLKGEVDAFLQGNQSVGALEGLGERLYRRDGGGGLLAVGGGGGVAGFNLPLINSLVLYVGIRAIQMKPKLVSSLSFFLFSFFFLSFFLFQSLEFLPSFSLLTPSLEKHPVCRRNPRLRPLPTPAHQAPP